MKPCSSFSTTLLLTFFIYKSKFGHSRKCANFQSILDFKVPDSRSHSLKEIFIFVFVFQCAFDSDTQIWTKNANMAARAKKKLVPKVYVSFQTFNTLFRFFLHYILIMQIDQLCFSGTLSLYFAFLCFLNIIMSCNYTNV